MATVGYPSDFQSTRETARPGLFRRFYAALVDSRMRKAERIVLRTRRSIHARGLIDAETGAPAKAGSRPLGL